MSLLPIRPGRLAAGFVLIALATGILEAASTTFWLVSTQSEFLKGEPDQVSIDSNGRVTLGPALETLGELEAPAVWRLAADDNDGVWAGTGSDGKLWYVGPSGEPKMVFDASELDLHALATAPGGAVYTASSPEGKVFRVERDGRSEVVFDPEEKYIWSLATARDGTLYVGTGDRGRIYRVKDGKGELFYDPEVLHVAALAFDPDGNLLVGTSSPGRVLRVDPSGKPFVLLESAYQEVRSLRISEGVIYATAAGATSVGSEPPPEPSTPETSTRAPIPVVSTEITVSAVGDTTVVTPATSGGTETRARSGPQKGAVYRIAPDGQWSTVWESPDDLPYDLLVEPTGALLVATGAKGKLFRLAGSPTLVTLVTRTDAQQITALARDRRGRLLLATSNPGRIIRVSASPAEKGTYLSEVRDTSSVATWGAIRWRATEPPGTKVELFTRSGNTAKPDKTWSDWSGAYTNPRGSVITSPKARYLQWRAVLTGTATATPVLTSVTAAYLPRNTRPVVESITVHPPGVVFQRPYTTGEPEIAGLDPNTSDGRPSASAAAGTPPVSPLLGRRLFQKSLQTFVWQARDADNDRLQYDVLYRLEGESDWKVLKRGLTDEIYTWDTTSVPDGTYLIKVVASDLSANAPDRALQGERESAPFDVDNTAPTIEVEKEPRKGVLTFTVRDSHSPIDRVEYSQNAGRWKLAYPVDGLLDSREERFSLTLDETETGPTVLRVTDALGNVATAVVPR